MYLCHSNAQRATLNTASEQQLATIPEDCFQATKLENYQTWFCGDKQQTTVLNIQYKISG